MENWMYSHRMEDNRECPYYSTYGDCLLGVLIKKCDFFFIQRLRCMGNPNRNNKKEAIDEKK